MLELSHPNLIQLYDAFETDSHLFLMLQLVTGGDLFQLIERRNRISVSETKFIAFQLLKALEYLHSQGVEHCDFKVENVCLDSYEPYPRCFLSDYGTARFQSGLSTTQCGTLTYSAPEILSPRSWRDGYDGKAADNWSFGGASCALAVIRAFLVMRHLNQ
jgi:serine/threonine protein kinase